MIRDLRPLLDRLADGEVLSFDDAKGAFDLLMAGGADLAQIAAFIMALRVRGETVDEIAAGAQSLRDKADRMIAPENAVDTCGTGGDGMQTLNISTASGLVAAAAGAIVTKHGNRSVSSKSGSSDVLMALGANLDVPVQVHQKCLEKYGFCFLFAPRHHAAVRHVAPARGSLKIRTIFNLLGPLANPAGAKNQVLGVYDKKWLGPMAQVLKKLGSNRVMVVAGSDGLDEISLSGVTHVAELKNGDISFYDIHPDDFGIEKAPVSALVGGDANYNAAALRGLLRGERDAYRKSVLLNAGAALYVGGVAATIQDGVSLAKQAIDSGKALKTTYDWVNLTQENAK